ncbi:AraC family transcriptional regulator [Paenibacillus sp. MER 99-2]|uniref:AraC family transcriptional regulator n=1 Tax=Paenibacillus sp. MER 99-2 TaxID=2939572 RepID=UPI00333FBD4B
MLPFRLYHNKGKIELPLSLYSCGLHHQHMMHRPIGYPTFQCMICFAGSGAFHFENIPYIKMKRGDILFVPGKLAHDYGPSATEPWLLGFMGIEGSFVETLVNTLQLPIMKPISVNEVKIQQLESDIRELWHVSEPEVSDPYHVASTKIYSMLTYIATTTHSEKPMQNNRSSTSAKEMLRASVQYMEQHYMDDLSLANIADTVGYSKQHFQRKFKEIYGVNPSHYLQRLRLLKGAELLTEHSELSVGEVATMVGMELNYFVRIFKRVHGITPAKYRYTV